MSHLYIEDRAVAYRTPLRSPFTREADGRRSGSTALTTAISVNTPWRGSASRVNANLELHPLFTGVRGRVILKSWLLREPKLLRSERPPEAFPGGLDELRGAYDPFDLGLGAVSPYVVFSEYLPQGHILLHAGEDVIGDLLLTRGEGGASRAAEEPLPEGSLVAHGDLVSPSFRLCVDEPDLTRSQPRHIFKRIVHRSAWKGCSRRFVCSLPHKPVQINEKRDFETP